MLTDVSERMNAFPTHTLEHIPLDELQFVLHVPLWKKSFSL